MNFRFLGEFMYNQPPLLQLRLTTRSWWWVSFAYLVQKSYEIAQALTQKTC